MITFTDGIVGTKNTTTLSQFITKAHKQLGELIHVYNHFLRIDDGEKLTTKSVPELLSHNDNIDFNAMSIWSLMNRCDEEIQYCLQEIEACRSWLSEEITILKQKVISATDTEASSTLILARRLSDFLIMQKQWEAVFSTISDVSQTPLASDLDES